MTKRRFALGMVLLGLAFGQVGCKTGPALRIGLTFKQGPEFSIQFAADPVTNVVVLGK